MKKVAVSLLFAAASSAQAAPPLPPTRWAGIDPKCFTKSEFLRRNEFGWTFFQLCKNDDNSWTATGAACKHGPATATATEVCDQAKWPTTAAFLTASVVEDLGIVQAARTKYLTDKWAENVKYDCVAESTDLASPYKPVCDELKKQEDAAIATLPKPPAPTPVPTPPPPPSPPPVGAWVVIKDPFSVGGKRAVFSVVNGAKGPIIVGLTIDPGSPCDPTVKVLSGVLTYAAVNGRLDQIAACAPQ